MWDGPGPRGGMPFCGEPRGGLFDGRNGPRPDFRGRDEMHLSRSFMDMRRFDCPPDMRGRDMGLFDRGRELSRDFFRPGNDVDVPFRRGFEMDQRNSQIHGLSRPLMDIDCRSMQGGHMRGPDHDVMSMRERDRILMDLPGISPMDMRRRLPMDAMGGNGDFSRMRDMERSLMGGNDGFNMDRPSRDRPMNFDRLVVTVSRNPREMFESDIDLRNPMGYRDQSAQMFREDESHPLDNRGRSQMPIGRASEMMLIADEMSLRDREFPERVDSPMGSRARESQSPSDSWIKHGMRDRESLSTLMDRPPPTYQREFPHCGDDADYKDDKDGRSGYEVKDEPSFKRPDDKEQNWEKSLPSEINSRDLISKSSLPVMDLQLTSQRREVEKSRSAEREEKPERTQPAGRQDKTIKNSSEKTSDKETLRESVVSGQEGSKNDEDEGRDQDYRDIDYRTGSLQTYDYKHGDSQRTSKDVKETTSDPAERLNESGSQDQDYRNAGFLEPVSRTITISGIPKTATLQQILNAFAVRDGKPIQGMKIKDVIPGYSFDMAYVEFLTLEDAIHFMESNKVAHPHPSTSALSGLKKKAGV